MAELRQFYESDFLPKLEELEGRAKDAESLELQLSVVWAPYADASTEGERR